MASNNVVGFGISAARMSATLIWAASFYASATSGFQGRPVRVIRHGFWGALMIMFIYPFAKLRQVLIQIFSAVEHAFGSSLSQGYHFVESCME